MQISFHTPSPSLSLYLSLALSLLSLSLFPLPYRPTDLPLPSQPFPPISFLLFPTSSFLYLRPPAPLFEIVSQESSLFLSLPLFQLPSPSLFLSLSHVTEHPMELSRSPRSDGHAFSRFVAISTEQKRERKLLAERWRGPVADAAAVVAGSGADGAERNGAGKAPAELINSDGPRYPANPLNDNIVRHHARLRRRIERER